MKQSDQISLLTKRRIVEANNNGTHVILAWIPGHQGIPGNHQADLLANVGRNMDIPLNIKLNFTNFLPFFEEDLWLRWRNDWQSKKSLFKEAYFKIVDNITRIPWFNNITYKQKQKTHYNYYKNENGTLFCTISSF